MEHDMISMRFVIGVEQTPVWTVLILRRRIATPAWCVLGCLGLLGYGFDYRWAVGKGERRHRRRADVTYSVITFVECFVQKYVKLSTGEDSSHRTEAIIGSSANASSICSLQRVN